MEKFLTSLIVSVLSNEKVQALIKDLLGQLITERILPLIPIAVAAASKAAVDQLIEKIPGIEGAVDMVTVATEARRSLDDLIPNISIPIIGDLGRFWR